VATVVPSGSRGGAALHVGLTPVETFAEQRTAVPTGNGPAGEVFDTGRTVVALIDAVRAKAFTAQPHHSCRYPVERLGVGLLVKRFVVALPMAAVRSARRSAKFCQAGYAQA
jgi:hypothetical protein